MFTSERRRIREVRRYYNRSSEDPPIFDGNADPESVASLETTPLSSPNSTLTALMQLITWRLGVGRAMVSVVDDNAQYFLAEATKSLDLADSSRYDPGDDLWMGCGGTIRSQALCAYTIEVVPEPNRYACFSVPDLSADPRFWNLPYVAGGPKFRYYAGTPLISNAGMPIGSVFVIDPRPREPATNSEIEFLGIMAKNVMGYLEMRRESMQLRRNDVMSKCLAALVEGQGMIPQHGVADTEHQGAIVDRTSKDNLANANLTNSLVTGDTALATVAEQSLNNIIQPPYSLVGENLFVNAPPSAPMDSLTTVRIDHPATHEHILSRAANLLRQSLDVDYTIFFDMSIGFSPNTDNNQGVDIDSGNDFLDILNSNYTESPPLYSNSSSDFAVPNESTCSTPSNTRSNEAGAAKVRSFSTPTATSLNGNILPSGLCRMPNENDLQRLAEKFPKGKVWSFNDYGSELSSDEEFNENIFGQMSQMMLSQNNDQWVKRNDRRIVQRYFPGAREVLFAPLSEAGTGSPIAGCFAVSLRDIPVFTSDTEKAFVRGFLNSVSIEYNRISIAAADRQKGDFISSISHELRSPLHGILGSAELLGETNLDNSQVELCATIETCGRVLQETLMDVLEYSKINNLRKDNPGQGNTKSIIRNQTNSQPLKGESISELKPRDEIISLPLDLARMCEDSVAIVATAYMHHNASSDHFYRVVQPPRAMSVQESQRPRKIGSVTVSLNIAFHDWSYFCSPGSIQRIIMNLVGNSLKYTPTGFIKISLRVDDLNKDNFHGSNPSGGMVVLQVSDSGKGISSEFLKSKLFTAFSQESSLAPGTGLGLHIVDSLVRMYNGTIDVQSQLGHGTTVTVRLPLTKATSGLSTIESSNASLTDDVAKLQELLGKLKNPSFSIHGFHSNASSSIETSLHGYLTQWFNLSNTPDTASHAINIAFVNENEFDGCLSTLDGDQAPSHIIVVRDVANHSYSSLHASVSGIPTEILTVPFGPCKLTKALIACLSPRQPHTKVIDYISPLASPTKDRDYENIPVEANGEQKTSVTELYMPTPSASSPQPKILCVDDNPINLRLLKAFFHKLKFVDVTCAENGALAFEAYRRRVEGYDLIFMDLSMPICDGFESTKLIRSLEQLQQSISLTPLPRTRVVALTGVCSLRDMEAAKLAGIDDFYTKPMKLSALAGMMREWGFLNEVVPSNEL